MIKAINKAGMITEFSQKIWDMLPHNKNGFVELSETQNTPNIPKEIIEFKIKKQELQKQVEVETQESKPEVVNTVTTKTDASSEMEIMREFLKEKGIKVSHLMGYDKLKAIYDENRE